MRKYENLKIVYCVTFRPFDYAQGAKAQGRLIWLAQHPTYLDLRMGWELHLRIEFCTWF